MGRICSKATGLLRCPLLQVIVAPSAAPPLQLLLPLPLLVLVVVCCAIIYDYWQTMETIR